MVLVTPPDLEVIKRKTDFTTIDGDDLESSLFTLLIELKGASKGLFFVPSPFDRNLINGSLYQGYVVQINKNDGRMYLIRAASGSPPS
ncbi:hypothetical protein ACTXT7_001951 [Hymenolepis weldensis]